MLTNKLLNKLSYEKEIELNALACRYYLEEKKKILVIDDNSNVTMFFNKVLGNDNNLIIDTVNSEYEAIKMFYDFNPDLVIMDVYLNDLNGFQLKSIFDKITCFDFDIIYMSVEKLIKTRNLLNGKEMINNFNFIQKPLMERDIINIVYKYLDYENAA